MTPVAVALGDVFLGIDHIGVAVHTLADGVARWTSLGLRETHSEANHEQGVAEAMLAVPTTDLYLQVLAPLSPESSVGRFLASHGQGMHQVAVRVSDIQEAGRRIVAHGMRLIYPNPAAGTAGSRINFVHPKDAGGVLVELVEAGDH